MMRVDQVTERFRIDFFHRGDESLRQNRRGQRVDHHRRIVAVDEAGVANAMVVDARTAALNVGEDIRRHFFKFRFPTRYWHTESLQEKILE